MTVNNTTEPEVNPVPTKTIYLVDTENRGSSLTVKLLNDNIVDREIYYFYTDNSMHPSFQEVELMIKYQEHIHFESCFNGFKNALDFQLSSYLGSLIATCDADHTRFIIISDDHGFDTLVRFWRKHGYSIGRAGYDTVTGIRSDEEKEPLYAIKKPQSSIVKTKAPEISPDADEAMTEEEPDDHWDFTKISDMPVSECEPCTTELPQKPEETPSIKQIEGYDSVMSALMEASEHAPEMVKEKLAKNMRRKRTGPNLVGMNQDRYQRACQIMSSQMGTILKKKKIKVNNVPQIAEFILCNPLYTEEDLLEVTDRDNAKKIFNSISRSVISGFIIVAKKRSW